MSRLLPFLVKDRMEAGCDEAGRGCLAGPVVAAAVILPPEFDHPLLNDSKKLTQRNREILRKIIEEEALAWAVSMASNREIDRLNILNASFKAMNRAIQKLQVQPEHLLIDGNRFRPETLMPFTCIIKGDGIYRSIAAASILAKTWRDEYMQKIHYEFPAFHWKQNKGYPTLAHRKAIQEKGISPYHRRSFRMLNHQPELFD
jgi:ribonuclease HII